MQVNDVSLFETELWVSHDYSGILSSGYIKHFAIRRSWVQSCLVSYDAKPFLWVNFNGCQVFPFTIQPNKYFLTQSIFNFRHNFCPKVSTETVYEYALFLNMYK